MIRLLTKERSRGQALVEFAVVAPVLLLMILALFDGGRAVLFYTELTNASRVGARVAIVNQSNDASCTGERTFKCAVAELTTGMGIAPSAVGDVAITGSDCSQPSDCTVRVTVNHSFQMITPVLSSIIGPINLSGSTTMPIERVYENPVNP